MRDMKKLSLSEKFTIFLFAAFLILLGLSQVLILFILFFKQA